MKTSAFALSLFLLLQQVTGPSVSSRQNIVVTVLDAANDSVQNLTAEDFVVEENGVPQQIVGFTEDSATPISLGILVDTSASMQSSLPAAIVTTRAVLSLTKPQDEFMLMTFNEATEDGPALTVEQPFTGDSGRMERRLRDLRARGGTELMNATLDALKEMKKAHHRRHALLLITDGGENPSPADLQKLARSIEDQEIFIYTLYLWRKPPPTPGVDPATWSPVVPTILDLLAAASGGETRTIPAEELASASTAERIIGFMQVIAAELRGQYTISYDSSGTGPAFDRVVRVRTKLPGYRVRFQRSIATVAEPGRNR